MCHVGGRQLFLYYDPARSRLSIRTLSRATWLKGFWSRTRTFNPLGIYHLVLIPGGQMNQKNICCENRSFYRSFKNENYLTCPKGHGKNLFMRKRGSPPFLQLLFLHQDKKESFYVQLHPNIPEESFKIYIKLSVFMKPESRSRVLPLVPLWIPGMATLHVGPNPFRQRQQAP